MSEGERYRERKGEKERYRWNENCLERGRMRQTDSQTYTHRQTDRQRHGKMNTGKRAGRFRAWGAREEERVLGLVTPTFITVTNAVPMNISLDGLGGGRVGVGCCVENLAPFVGSPRIAFYE